jgi:hypothetical protein
MKTNEGVEVQLHEFLILAVDGGECSTSRPSRFTPRVKAPGAHWIEGRVGPRAFLDAVVNTKIIPAPNGNRIPALQAVAQSLY